MFIVYNPARLYCIQMFCYSRTWLDVPQRSDGDFEHMVWFWTNYQVGLDSGHFFPSLHVYPVYKDNNYVANCSTNEDMYIGNMVIDTPTELDVFEA